MTLNSEVETHADSNMPVLEEAPLDSLAASMNTNAPALKEDNIEPPSSHSSSGSIESSDSSFSRCT